MFSRFEVADADPHAGEHFYPPMYFIRMCRSIAATVRLPVLWITFDQQSEGAKPLFEDDKSVTRPFVQNLNIKWPPSGVWLWWLGQTKHWEWKRKERSNIWRICSPLCSVMHNKGQEFEGFHVLIYALYATIVNGENCTHELLTQPKFCPYQKSIHTKLR